MLIPAGLAVLGAATLAVLWRESAPAPPAVREPGADAEPPKVIRPADIKGAFRTFDGVAAKNVAGAWPGFRGPDRDNISRETTPLLRNFDGEKPKELWRLALGDGYAAPAVRNGRVYLLDYDEAAKADALRVFSLADGREIWRRSYNVVVKQYHGMSRTIPAVTDQYVVTLGPKCQVLCCRAESGEFLWGIDLAAEYGATVPEWYAGQCPIIEEDEAILAPGGPDALLLAVECETGRVLWKTPNPDGWKMTHGSVLPMRFAGRKMYVYPASRGVLGVDAETGEVLWRTTAWTVKIANVPTPVPLGEGNLFLTGGYDAGSMFLQLTEKNGKIVAQPGRRLDAQTFSSDQQTPIFFDGRLYAVLPKAGPSGRQLACFDPAGGRLWTSGPDDTFGLGPFLIAQTGQGAPLLLAADDHGVLTLAEVSTKGYTRLARKEVLDGHDAWAPLALVEGRLLLRDRNTMICLDLRAKTNE
jgi:outer membrane protein assembly factor BamB